VRLVENPVAGATPPAVFLYATRAEVAMCKGWGGLQALNKIKEASGRLIFKHMGGGRCGS
jgi:hypothetical protein